MKRRNFIKSIAPLGLYPLAMSGLPINRLAATAPFVFNPCNVTDRSMVIIFLSGANDIINTVVPLNQLSDYANHRPDIRLPENSLITLDGTLPDQKQVGLHPSLTGLKSLYDAGKMALVQRVGYAEPNRSHFKSLENWLTGSGGALQNLENGWVERFLRNRYPGYGGQPFFGEPDPLGVLFGNMNATGFHTLAEHRYDINLSGQDLSGFYTLIASIFGEPIANLPNSEYGEKLAHIQSVGDSVNVYAQRISETFNNGQNSGVTYPENDLGGQLKTIARMLAGGSRTKIFMATQAGFDTHVAMVDPTNTATGYHATLMGFMGNSLKAFQDDLTNMGLDDKVVTVVFSEFGRKVIQNSSLGLDHGTLSSMFVIGKGVNGGVLGNNLNLSDLDTQGAINPLQLQHDYRQVFATLLQDWFGANNPSLAATFLDSNIYGTPLNLVKSADTVPPSCYYTPVAATACACIRVKIMLEGYYDVGTQLMTDGILQEGLVPVAQPYNVAPFNYNGTEQVSTFPPETVDWVLLELRSTTNTAQIVQRKAFFVRRDGFLTDFEGNPAIEFPGVLAGSYYLAVHHRSHLAVLSAEPVNTDFPNYLYNFTLGVAMAAGEEQMAQIGSIAAMRAGDLNGDHLVNHLDFNKWELENGQTGLYSPTDINGDTKVDSNDYNFWDLNRSKIGFLKTQ